ncbi:hypothetical protein ACFWFB_33735, partial [Streptomyces albidoflavus]
AIQSGMADALFTVARVFGVVTGAAVVTACVGLVRTALRGPRSSGAEPQGVPRAEVDLAEEAWRQALLERGILPFLRDALDDPGATTLRRTAEQAPSGRVPHLGHDRPQGGPPPGRPRFTSQPRDDHGPV